MEEQCIMNVLYDLYSWNVLSNTAARHEAHFSRNPCQNCIQSDLVQHECIVPFHSRVNESVSMSAIFRYNDFVVIQFA